LISTSDILQFQTHELALKEKNTDIYQHSPFRVYKEMSSKKKGKYFELLVAEYLSKKGFEVQKALSSDYDRLINGCCRLEIKGSLLWGEGTHFRWQQIRTGQAYDVICFLAIYPDQVKLYGATKEIVCYNVEVQDEKGFWTFNQHGGKKVNSGTFVIDGFPEDFPWMQPLEEVLSD
jgi:hypothetical protein